MSSPASGDDAPVRWPASMPVLLAALLATACSGQQEPARQTLAAVQTAVNAAAEAAEGFAPDQAAAARSRAAALQSAFERGDFAAVLAGAPQALADAQALVVAARSGREAFLRSLTVEWQRLSAGLPDLLGSLQVRFDALAALPSASGAIDPSVLETARRELELAQGAWQEAATAYAAEDIEFAVENATAAEDRALAVIASLGLAPPAPRGAL